MNDPLVADVTASMPELRRYALRLTRNAEDADDLVQDCMVRALSKLHLFERGTNLEAWLTTILRNLFINRCKAVRRCTEVELDDDASVRPAQEHRVELKEVGRALKHLSEEQRFLVCRCGVEGRSYKAVAAQLGVSMGTVRSRLNRARARLRDIATAVRRNSSRSLRPVAETRQTTASIPRSTIPSVPAGRRKPAPRPALVDRVRCIRLPARRASGQVPRPDQRPGRRRHAIRAAPRGLRPATIPALSVDRHTSMWATPPPDTGGD